jgi:hypothetical protein
MMPRKADTPYDPEAMNDIWSRQWFKRMWTIQELVMASEPWVVCGSKTIRWNSLHWGIVAAKNIEEAWDNPEFRDVFYFVLSAESFWLDMYRKVDWTESYVQKWLVGKDLEHASPIRRRIFTGLTRYGKTASNLYFILIFIIIVARYVSGLRPLNSIPPAVLAFSCAATLVCTPPGQHLDLDKDVKRKLVRLLNQRAPVRLQSLRTKYLRCTACFRNSRSRSSTVLLVIKIIPISQYIRLEIYPNKYLPSNNIF